MCASVLVGSESGSFFKSMLVEMLASALGSLKEKQVVF